MTEHTAYIGLGSNLGDRHGHLQQALSRLEVHPSITLVEVSSLYETVPLGLVDQSAFLNGVAEIKTTVSCRQLFELLQTIEQELERQRNEHWGPRTIDLDLLLYDDIVVNEPGTMRELAGRLNGGDYWLDSEKPQLISIAGNIGVGKTTLATGLAERLEAKLISEKYDANPFLADVYAGKTELALDSELFFLSSSASQLRKDRMKAGRVYVNDYVFEKAHIYASGWLEPADLAKYEKHFDSMCEGVTSPILVIYLNDSVEHCLQRIHQRNRPYEQQIEPAFLEHLARGYDALYTDYTVSPVIRLGSDECRTAEQVDRIAEEVKYYIAKSQE
ncbi:MAG: 2-amino-4-hydroxy-6-hydroxymethyldihydropteridine diphosphokinase [Planctomycetota bacterium]|jgi:2-amino-4-hydroxy-6-hydroxymethyldihydropteridine diphosphokinase